MIDALITEKINEKLVGCGFASNLTFSLWGKYIEFDVHLKGEQRSIHVVLESISIKRMGDRYFLIAGKVKISRAWMSHFIPDRIEISPGIWVFPLWMLGYLS